MSKPYFRLVLSLVLGSGLFVTLMPAFVSNRSVWSSGEVVVQLGLGTSETPLRDGSASYDAVAEWVVGRWTPFLNRTSIRIVQGTPGTDSEFNGLNEVIFSDTLYGESFDEALAISYGFSRVGEYRTENDIIVNTGYTWDSYRGNLDTETEDLRRVLLHEFGHFLGLDHPDEDLQFVNAIMNSRVSDADGLLDDDIEGVIYLYGSGGHEGGVGDADDHGGLFSTATPVELESSTTAVLQDWDRDIFKIEVPGWGALDVQTTGDMDLFGFEFVAPSTLWNYNDDAGAGANMRLVSPYFEATTVYIAIQAIEGNTEGNYTLDVTFHADALNGDTVSRRFSRARLIPATGSVEEAMNYTSDADLYRIELEEFGILTVSSTGPTDVLGGLFDGDEELIVFDDDSGPGSNFEFTSRVLAPGTYYIDVSSLIADDLGPYKMTSSFEVVKGTGSNRPRLSNMSVRTGASGEFGPLIMGFVTAGSTKSLLVRAVGQGLADFGVPDHMKDPQMTLFDSNNEEVGGNDDWNFSDDVFQISTLGDQLGAFELESALDAALIAQPEAGAYTLVVSDVEDEAGQVLIEAYDADPEGSPGRLINLSTRAEIGLNGTFLTAGFVVQGEGITQLLIRGVGPELANFGVTGALVDPTLQVFDGEGKVVAENDDWGDAGAAVTSVSAASGAFALTAGSLDAALLVELPAGVYTVQLKGKGEATGQGLIELYEAP